LVQLRSKCVEYEETMLIHTVGNKQTRPMCFKCFVQSMPAKCDHFKTEVM
jgi:hypothetical protein